MAKKTQIRSLSVVIQRAEKKLTVNDGRIAMLRGNIERVTADIDKLLKENEETRERITVAKARLERREADGLRRSRTPLGELSTRRDVRLRQVLNRVCGEAGLKKPSWIKTIADSDIRYREIDELLEQYVLSDDGIAPGLTADQRSDLSDQVRALMAGARRNSEKPSDLWSINPDFDFERAVEQVGGWRVEGGVTAERAVILRKRHLLVSTAWSGSVIDGDWLDDLAVRLPARLRLDGRRMPPNVRESGKAAAAIEIAINKDKPRSLAHLENDARLMEAVAVYATPGAMAAAYHRGLSADQRASCADWFGKNRDLVMTIGHRVGTEATFAELLQDPAPFRARHGRAAPKFAPGSRIWARKKKDVVFQGVPPEELIEEARHALTDLSLHSHLISLPINKSGLLHLGAWEGAEMLHSEFVDVGAVLTKGFVTAARDAAEIQLMQGTNPLAMTAGLVSWKSIDGVERQAPLFLVPLEFDEAAKTIRRLSDFVINSALQRRIALDYPALPGSADSFEALLGDVVLTSPLGAVFERVAAAINVGAAVGGRPILKIEDVCLVGAFDSARSVLERRLNLSVFGGLVDNPVVKMLALGAKATGKDQVVESEFDPEGARSRPDRIQALAVKALLGGTSFVLEGPPGTGKTQTIVAMIEALSKRGRRVLVSAAMPGAIGVIHRRLHGFIAHEICSVRKGQIELAGPTVHSDRHAKKLDVVIGTPMALVSELASDDKYDVLIVDEASQLRLSHALALCGHVSQIIVAGDSRQLQPRDSEAGLVSESSLLARARLAGFPVIMLERHYRSRHPSLIAWSNVFSYESMLKPNLGPYLRGDAGFDVVYVHPGRRLRRDVFQVNVEEAEAIAAECLRWARDGRRTVGVAALTQGQRDLIRETVERELSEAKLSAALAGPDNRFFSKEEPFFIRTAGAVQGEERDVMIVSLGVAPNVEGKISQHTGALSRPDGLAVANVLLSRARLRTVVYSSVLPWEINLAAMTPGMFLIASMLRMATVIVAPDRGVDEPIHANFVFPDWTAHRLEVAGEPVIGFIHCDIPDRYALGVSFLKDSKRSPAFYLLLESGWEMDYGDIRSLTSDNGSLRRDIGLAMAKVLAAADKKSKPATA